MLHLHRAERSDTLADALGDVLAEPMADPFTAEVVAVPARGVERWLTQRLAAPARRTGPAGRRRVRACRLSLAGRGRGSPPSRAPPASTSTTTRGTPPGRCGRCWRSSTRAPDAWCAPLDRASAGGRRRAAVRRGRAPGRPVRRLRRAPPRAARRVAGRRRRGRARRPARGSPSCGERLRARIAGPDPAERLGAAVAALERDPDARRPAGAAVAVRSHPAPGGPSRRARRARAAPRRAPVAAAPLPRAVGPGRRAPPAGRAVGHAASTQRPHRELPRHPLLASLGRDVRELQLRLVAVLDALGLDADERHHAASGRPRARRCCSACSAICATTMPRPGTTCSPRTTGPSGARLSRTAPAGRGTARGRARPAGRRPDAGAARRPDRLPGHRHLRAARSRRPSGSSGTDPGDEGHPGHRLAVRLADRALRQVNPVLDVVARLLELADSAADGVRGARPARARARSAAASASTVTTSTGCATS